ncbi:MAG TPA: NUDIX domain-containing protein [Ktedonobacteraceae bacterium]
MVAIPYTVCFCLRGSQVLMLYRKNPPNAARWNGLGGRIEDGETPLESVQREIKEEAGIDLAGTGELSFTGLVTWDVGKDPTRPSSGMYTYLARLEPDFPTWPDRPMNEGLLSWKPLDWVCDPSNPAVVSNIPRFLPLMLADPAPREYYCVYRWGKLREVIVQAMPPA